jgi:hypothetical protein
MPLNQTVTAFYTFATDSRARASEVNTNFSTFRGHLMSVDPNTSTSTNLIYDLGSDDHRWRTLYCRDIDLKSSTSSASLVISGDTSATLGAFSFEIGGAEKFRITPSGYIGYKATPGAVTTTAGLGQFAMSPTLTVSVPNADVTLIANSTITITTVGRPVRFGIMTGNYTSGGYFSIVGSPIFTTSTTTHPYSMQFYVYNSVGSLLIKQVFRIEREAYIFMISTRTTEQVPKEIFSGVVFLPAGVNKLYAAYNNLDATSLSLTGHFYAYEV